MRTIRIAPSILAADFIRIGEIIKGLKAYGADRIHIDVMDGHFVNNITFGPALIAAIRKETKLPFETHLMIERPDRYIKQFVDAGSDALIVHYEARHSLPTTLKMIKSYGKEAGIAISPPTPLRPVLPHLRYADMLLVMSVNPGFGGQKFIPGALGKIRGARKYIDENGCATKIGVDGGIDTRTAPLAVGAGADELIIGSAIFHSKNTRKAIRDFKMLCK